MGNRWATVTVTDSEGRRHSVDVYAASTYDAAHLFVAHAKADPRNGLPPLGPSTMFEVVVNGRIHHVQGSALQRWIIRERQERKGPAGFLFSQRPVGVQDVFGAVVPLNLRGAAAGARSRQRRAGVAGDLGGLAVHGSQFTNRDVQNLGVRGPGGDFGVPAKAVEG